MDSPMFENLRVLISLVDQLRDIGLQNYINLPRVCVVGTQSSGKSSVLESIVGIDFLPRGEGVVTRRPLELRLIHTRTDSPPYAIFENNKNEKITDFSEVRARIDKLTDEAAGKNKAIVDLPIVLSIYASDCPDLTLIDLPGITRVPLSGSDQPDDIEKLTRDMAMRYAQDPRTIILAVIAANADISTSDALQLARKVDKNGLRTIGVITKIDLMDRGTNAAKMLMGEDIPLRLGYVGVKNRSQRDITENKSIKQSIQDEEDFFKNNSYYSNLPQSVLGSSSLIIKLTNALFRHIRHLLPEIRTEIDSQRRKVNDRIKELGDSIPPNSTARTHKLWTMVNEFCQTIESVVRGRYVRKQAFHDQEGLLTGSKIRLIFNNFLIELLEKNCTSDLTDTDIDRAIQLHEGDSLPGFPSPDTLEYLILPHMTKLFGPSMDCIVEVTKAMEFLFTHVATGIFYRFPSLNEQILRISEVILNREMSKTQEIIQNIVEAETSYLFTNDPNYLDEHGSMIKYGNDTEMNENANFGQNSQINSLTKTKNDRNSNTARFVESLTQKSQSLLQSASSLYSREQKKRYSPQLISELRNRMDSYFLVVVKNLRDTIPKCLGHFLVRSVLETLKYELYTVMSENPQLELLFGETPMIVEEREKLNKQINVLNNAHQILTRDPSLTPRHLDSLDFEIAEEAKNKHYTHTRPIAQTLTMKTEPSTNTTNNGLGSDSYRSTTREYPKANPSTNMPNKLMSPSNPNTPTKIFSTTQLQNSLIKQKDTPKRQVSPFEVE